MYECVYGNAWKHVFVISCLMGSLKPLCLMFPLWSYATACRASVVPGDLGEDKWRGKGCFRKLHNWDQILSSSQMKRQYYNYSLSELFLFFHLPFIFPLGGGHMVCGLCVWACLGVLVCVCVYVRTWEGERKAQNPINGDMYWFAVLFKAFWDISTDVSFNVRASGRKQTNLLLLLPSFLPLFYLFYLFPSLSVTLHQSLAHMPLLCISSLFSSLCYYKMQHFPSSFFLSFFSLCLLLFTLWEPELMRSFFWGGHRF